MNPIDFVKERLDGGRLWQKRDVGWYDMPDEPVCLMGACHFVSQHNLSASSIGGLLATVIVEQYPDRIDGEDDLGAVAPFNDHEDTTWLDVELVLDKASVLWDEAHQ